MSYEELTAELKNLKKRLYTFKLKGMELHQRARNHISTHRMAELFGHGSTEEYEKEADMKFEAFGPHQNPLSNEYILEMIAFHLPMKDLHNCKKICKLWAVEFQRCEMKRKSIVVASDDDTEPVLELIKQKREGNLISLSTLVILSTSLETRAVRLVVNNFGATLSSLRLDECTMTATELYTILKNLPCLDHLSVKTNDMIRRRVDVADPLVVLAGSPLDQITSNSFSPTLVMSYLRELSWEDDRAVKGLERLPILCPNLVAIQISNVGLCQPERYEGVKWKSLKALDLKFQRNRALQHFYFIALTNMGLKLKKLCLKNVEPDSKQDGSSTMNYLKEFLQGTKDSLENLKITRPVQTQTSRNHRINRLLPMYPKDSPLPVYMPSLKSLTIDMEFINAFNTMLDDLPSLEKLTCCKSGYWMNWWKLLRQPSCKSSSTTTTISSELSELSELNLGAIDAECLKKIMISLPNITTLEIAEDRVNDKLFSTICGTLPKLKVLRIRKAQRAPLVLEPHLQLTDCGITGIPLEAYKSATSNQKSLLLDEQNVESLRIYPNIRDLKELQILEINCAPELSDMSLFYGFVGLPSLLVVHLPKCNISDASLERFPNLLISRDMDGGRRIRVKSMVNESLNTLLNLVTETAVIKNPLSLFGEMVVERAELGEFHD